jgi:hypothetical protein
VSPLAQPLESLLELAGTELPGHPDDEDAFPWRRAVFQVARVLQRLGFTDPNADDLKVLLWAWHGRLTGCRCGADDVWGELLRCWANVKDPGGLPLAEIWARPDPRPVPAALYHLAGDPHWEALLRGLRNLADYWRGEPFPLACRTAAELLTGVLGEEVSFKTANRRLNTLARVRVIREVAKGSMRRLPGTDTMTASTWLWVAKEE